MHSQKPRSLCHTNIIVVFLHFMCNLRCINIFLNNYTNTCNCFFYIIITQSNCVSCLKIEKGETNNLFLGDLYAIFVTVHSATRCNKDLQREMLLNYKFVRFKKKHRLYTNCKVKHNFFIFYIYIG